MQHRSQALCHRSRGRHLPHLDVGTVPHHAQQSVDAGGLKADAFMRESTEQRRSCLPANVRGGLVMRTFPAVDRSASHETRLATHLPMLLTIDEAADLLRTSRRAIYAMIARRQLPDVVRIRRRVLVRSADLLDWLHQKRAPSPEE